MRKQWTIERRSRQRHTHQLIPYILSMLQKSQNVQNSHIFSSNSEFFPQLLLYIFHNLGDSLTVGILQMSKTQEV